MIDEKVGGKVYENPSSLISAFSLRLRRRSLFIDLIPLMSAPPWHGRSMKVSLVIDGITKEERRIAMFFVFETHPYFGKSDPFGSS